MAQKRVNFNIDEECHALLKSVCALKGLSVSEYVYQVLTEEFKSLVRTNTQVQHMFLAGEYKTGSKAHHIQQALLAELDRT